MRRAFAVLAVMAGAGSVVREDVPQDGLAVGVPARIIEGRGDKMRKVEAADPDEEPPEQSQ
jgi:serine acetyltransferase